MTDFSAPRHMSRGAYIIIFLSKFKDWLWGLAIFLSIKFLESGHDDSFDGRVGEILAISGIIIVLAAIFALIEYRSKKFYVKDGSLVLIHGVFQRETTTIPLKRIHSLRTKRGLFYRLFEMRGVGVDTIASKGEEIELILDESDWDQLLLYIEKEESKQPDSSVPPTYNPKSTIKYSNANLLKGALCQNHLKGLVVLMGFFAAIFDKINDFTEDSVEKLAEYALEHNEILSISPVTVVSLFILAYLAVLLLWLGKVVLRYYDMTITEDTNLLTFDSGLVARASSRFAYDKVCTILVKRNIIEKKLKCCTVMLKQALNATADKEEDKLRIYGADSAKPFIRWWLGADYAQERTFATAKSGTGVLLRTSLPRIILSVIAATVLWLHQLYGWIIIPGIYALISIFRGICAMRHSRLDLKETYIRVNNGHFADIRNYIKYSDVEVVRIIRTPLTYRFGRVTLELATPGSTFRIRSIKETEAAGIYEMILYKAEEKRHSTVNSIM